MVEAVNLTIDEKNLITDKIANRLKEYSTISPHILKTLIANMLKDGIAEINNLRNK